VQVRLFGDFRIYDGARLIGSDLGHAGRMLASYLFCFPKKPHRREKLASLFWPDQLDEKSRGAMNSAIWRLRKLVGMTARRDTKPAIRTVGLEVIFDQPPWLEIDTQTFATAIRSCCNRPETLCNPCALHSLQEALALHDEPFLPHEDGDWIVEERGRLQSLYARGCVALIRQLARDGAYGEAADVARRALRADPYREQMVRLYVGLLTLDEQRLEALRYFVQWADLLKSELGVAPMPATLELISLVKSAETAEDFANLSFRLIASAVPCRSGELH
jgi:DNA-binding SARP family transcriptional activator